MRPLGFLVALATSDMVLLGGPELWSKMIPSIRAILRLPLPACYLRSYELPIPLTRYYQQYLDIESVDTSMMFLFGVLHN